MKKAVACLALSILAIVLLSSLVKVGQASTISVGTYDISGAPRDTFARMEDVRIIAQSSNKPITIKIFDPDNIEVFSITIDMYIYDATLSDITTKHGVYTVEASSPMSSTRSNFATVFFNVVPEVPLGTASIALVGIGAFGAYGLL